MRKILTLFVIALLLSLAACTGKQEAAPAAPAAREGAAPTGEEKPEAEEKASVFENLKDAMAANAPMKCTWQDQQGNSGEMLVKGKKFTSEVTAQGMKAHSISDGTYIYAWVEGQPQGTKMKLVETEQQKPQEGQPSGTPDMSVKVSCRPAFMTGNEFTPPSDIEFMDLSELMQKYGQGYKG